ncbi:inorganic diphosphatase [Acidithiobacillus thiooxidans]|uniref:inorganic diphosphatase n=1 Tax=Acidithiobacillus TaxID=119977 RepID=UPI0009D9D3C6|nr:MULTISPECIES: inorganic diphosphatase [Acidithiobacillus]MBE7566720.1 inorganic diphosphatase [Acidithiobacillus sp. HP-11]MBU2752249.1 inorganic diphosphatase [Acidithiobacillus thiooxidans]MBU2794153.1 inorganic diphosphatase [Acidithiobacillus thiooxidans]
MDLKKIPAGKSLPDDINVVIEVPQGSSVKYEMDKEAGAVFVDRFLFTAMHYPLNYGFIPNTLSDDGDPTDCLVWSPQAVAPGTVIRARPVGVLMMEDEHGIDAKIVAVPHEKVAGGYADIRDVEDLPENIRQQIRHFFEHYKDLEPGKWVKMKDWANLAEARKIIEADVKRHG